MQIRTFLKEKDSVVRIFIKGHEGNYVWLVRAFSATFNTALILLLKFHAEIVD